MDRLILVLLRKRLRLLDRFLRLLSEFVESNHKLKGQVGDLPHLPASAPIIPRTVYSLASIFTWRGLAASFFGNRTVSTPFLYSAATFSESTDDGTVKLRSKVP